MFRPYRVLLTCLIFGLLSAPTAGAAEGKFESQVRALRPAVPGLELKVVEEDKKLELDNKTGRTVIVEGYDGEPYLRFRPDGAVDRNARSPATYLNVDRYGSQKVPSDATGGAKPSWRPVGNGPYSWFDHRIHLTLKRLPPELRNLEKPRKVFDWEVPLAVSGRPVRAVGTLTFDPTSSSDGFPAWIVVAIAALAVLGAGAFVLLRRRQPRPATEAPEKKPSDEAW